MRPIYLDHNATTPVAPEVAGAMIPHLRGEFGNPSSDHWYGRRARAAVEGARARVASLLGCGPAEVVFTSGGTESNNHAIRGYALANRERGRHLVTSAVEHPAVLEVCADLGRRGFEVTVLPVDGQGRVRLEEIEGALRPDTILVTIMLANNEVGTIQPIARIARLLGGRGIALHSDAAQAVGKIPVRVGELGVDLLSVAGHKFYAPKGVGALYVRQGVRLERLVHGASHESGRRAGTENVAGVVGLGAACELVERGLDRFAAGMRGARDRLEARLRGRIPWMRENGPRDEGRLPNTLSVSFPGVEAGAILAGAPGVAASAGAACHAESVAVSHVLRAMGVPERNAIGTIRLSTGRGTTEEEVDRAAGEIAGAVEGLRRVGTPHPPPGASS